MNTFLKIIFPLFILVLGCSSDDDTIQETEQVNRLQDCKADYLFFNDGIRFMDNNFNFFQLDSIVFDYENQYLSKVLGGFRLYDPISSFTNKLLSNNVYDSVVRVDNDYKVYTVNSPPYYFTDNPDNPVEYSIVNGQLQHIIRRDGFLLNYSYENNTIIERDTNEVIRRKFYIENDNLIKVELFSYNWNFEMYGKTEILFEDYDANPNPLKDQFHLLGGFYRSFSENNYRTHIIKVYDMLDNGSFELIATSAATASFEYNENNSPLFGNYE